MDASFDQEVKTVPQPTPYERQYDFSDFQQDHPSEPLPGNQVDAELDAVKLTFDQTLRNLALIQRDDGKLGNATVHTDAFDARSLMLIGGSAGWQPRGEWEADGILYAVKDMVEHDGSAYVCTVNHASAADFETDRAAGRWLKLFNDNAGSISFDPTGTLTSDTIQQALAEENAQRIAADEALEQALEEGLETREPAFTDASEKTVTATGSLWPRTLGDRFAEAYNVRDYGAIGDGQSHPVSEWIEPSEGARYGSLTELQADYPFVESVDDEIDWAAFRAAFAAAGGNSQVVAPPGEYVINKTVPITKHRVHFSGAGLHATKIYFRPESAATLFLVDGEDEQYWQGSLRNFALDASDSASVQKIGIDLVNTSDYLIENISVRNWTGNTSIGIRFRGRELTTARKLNVFADVPVYIGQNPYRDDWANIDCDHLHLQDCYLGPLVSTGDCIRVQDGILLTNLTIDGYQAWVKGRHGLYVNSTTGTLAWQDIAISNVRREQEETEGYVVYLAASTHQIQNVSCRNIKAGVYNGYYLRNVKTIRIENHHQGRASTIGLNVDGTVEDLAHESCFWQQGSTAQMTGQYLLYGTPNRLVNTPLPPTGHYTLNERLGMTAGEWSTRQPRRWVKQLTVNPGTTGIMYLLPPMQDTFTAALVTVVGRNSTDGDMGGQALVTSAGGTTRLSGTSNFDVGNVAGKFTVIRHGPNTIYLLNQLNDPMPVLCIVEQF